VRKQDNSSPLSAIVSRWRQSPHPPTILERVGAELLVLASDRRSWPSGARGVMTITGTARPTGIVLSLAAFDTSRDRPTGALGIEPFRRICALAIRSFEELQRGRAHRAAIATDPIRSRETSAQHARTSFRHPHDETSTAGADRRSIRADGVVLPSSLPTTGASEKPQVNLPGRIFGTHTSPRSNTTSASGPKRGTTIPNHSSGTRLRTRSSTPSPDIANESLAQLTSGVSRIW
jgi:hypothetical protein